MTDHIYTRTVRGTYTTRAEAIQAACNWYGTTIGYTPITEGKRKLPTTIIDAEHPTTVLGEVIYDPKVGQYILWMYPKCSTFHYIRAGDSIVKDLEQYLQAMKVYAGSHPNRYR